MGAFSLRGDHHGPGPSPKAGAARADKLRFVPKTTLKGQDSPRHYHTIAEK